MVRRASINGVTPGGQQPRFPGFDVLAEAEAWDPVTAGVVLARLGPQQGIRFFTPTEQAVARRLFDLLLDQREEPKVPVLEMVDARLVEANTDGWHYEQMPEDGQAWRQTLAALDADAHGRYGAGFAHCDWDQQVGLVQAVQDLGSNDWHGFCADQVWSLWTRYACTAFYSHPWVWNEMGFSGPAYPRGYKRATVGGREPWEVADHHARDPVRDPS
jgi:hypothetical protein